MKVTVNERFVSNRKRLGRWGQILGWVLMVGGLAASWLLNDLMLGYVGLLPGFLLVNYGRWNSIRFGANPRMDQAIATSLKTLDARHQFFSYVDGLPIDHLLLTPSGLIVLELRPYFGDFVNKGDQWRRSRSAMGLLMFLGEGGLGNPTRDVLRSVAMLRKFLAGRMGEEDAGRVPIEGMVVFTSPQAKLEVDDPSVPAMHVRDLKAALRRGPGQPKVPSDLQRKLGEILRVEET